MFWKVTLSGDEALVAVMRGRFLEAGWAHAASVAVLYTCQRKVIVRTEMEVRPREGCCNAGEARFTCCGGGSGGCGGDGARHHALSWEEPQTLSQCGRTSSSPSQRPGPWGEGCFRVVLFA
jgi:hypothetical protein